MKDGRAARFSRSMRSERGSAQTCAYAPATRRRRKFQTQLSGPARAHVGGAVRQTVASDPDSGRGPKERGAGDSPSSFGRWRAPAGRGSRPSPSSKARSPTCLQHKFTKPFQKGGGLLFLNKIQLRAEARRGPRQPSLPSPRPLARPPPTVWPDLGHPAPPGSRPSRPTAVFRPTPYVRQPGPN